MAAELATSLTPANDNERLEQAESVVRDFCGWHIAPSVTPSSRPTVPSTGACICRRCYWWT